MDVGDESLRQGDIFPRLVVFAPAQSLPVLEEEPAPGEKVSVEGEWDVGGWIVMSASCDVGRASADYYPHVLVAKVYPATAEELKAKGRKLDEVREAIRRGLDFHRFLLAECPPLDFPRSYVEFRPHLTVPVEFLKRACQTRRRLRLESPFREQFGNWVGANVSRVGIEDEAQIPPYKTGTTAAAMLGLDDLADRPRSGVIERARRQAATQSGAMSWPRRALSDLRRRIRGILKGLGS
jgi:hypothetical protein